jgi:hypothetical protein
MRGRLFLPRLAFEAMANLRDADAFPKEEKQFAGHPERS